MAKDLFGRYVWIVDTLNRYGKLTRAELSDLWKRSPRGNGEELPARTFFHYRRAIEENFNIDIQCNSRGEYFIPQESSNQSKALTNWMLEQYALSSAVKEAPDAAGRIEVEDEPSAREFFSMVYEAVTNKKRIFFSYAGFNRSRIEKDIEFCPLLLKRYKQRWYMVGTKGNGNSKSLRTYALDRVREMRLTNDSFEPALEDSPSAIFADIIGITTSRAPVKTVKMLTNTTQAKYFRALPLHPSQLEMASDTYSIFSYQLRLNYELVHEILSLGNNVKVLEPPELVTMVTNELRGALDLYEIAGSIPGENLSGQPRTPKTDNKKK